MHLLPTDVPAEEASLGAAEPEDASCPARAARGPRWAVVRAPTGQAVARSAPHCGAVPPGQAVTLTAVTAACGCVSRPTFHAHAGPHAKSGVLPSLSRPKRLTGN